MQVFVLLMVCPHPSVYDCTALTVSRRRKAAVPVSSDELQSHFLADCESRVSEDTW